MKYSVATVPPSGASLLLAGCDGASMAGQRGMMHGANLPQWLGDASL